MGDETLAWIISHSFRKTAAKILDEAALPACLVTDLLGHARPSMTQDFYLARRAADSQAAVALEAALGKIAEPASAEGNGKKVAQEGSETRDGR